MSEKRLIATGAVTRCPYCNGARVVLNTRSLRHEWCWRCLGEGNIVRFEAYEKARV